VSTRFGFGLRRGFLIGGVLAIFLPFAVSAALRPLACPTHPPTTHPKPLTLPNNPKKIRSPTKNPIDHICLIDPVPLVITFRPIARGTAADYFLDDLNRKSDSAKAAAYYLETGTTAPEWGGKLAEDLGLAGQEPTRDQLALLLDGYHPITGEDLVARRTKDRRQGTDIVASAPKSVSVMAMFDDRIPAFVREASRLALGELEKYSGVRVRAGGASHSEPTGKMVWLAVNHGESREGDPNCHIHFCTSNLTMTPDGKFRALDCGEALRRTRLFTEVFRNRLAEQLRTGGYELRHEKDGFEIEGAPKEVLKLYSKSRAKIEEAERDLELRLGRTISNDERAVIAKEVKRPKNKNLTAEEIRAYQLSQLDPATKAKLQSLATNARSSSAGTSDPQPADGAPAAAGKEVIADECAEFAKRHIFERTTITQTWRIAEWALRNSQGRCSWNQVKKAIGRLDLIRDGVDCTTAESQALERKIIAFAEDGKGRYEPFATSVDITGLAPEQARLAEKVVGSRDRVILASAPPGAGKSYALRSISKAIPDAVCVAPTASAVEVLVSDGIEARTLDSLLNHRASHAGIRTVIVDEASLVSTQQCSRLIDYAELHRWRVICSGDVKQNKSPSAGSPLSLLSRYSTTERGELTIIRRQKPKPYRTAVKLMSHGRFDKAFDAFEKMGAIEECCDADERRQAAARFYCDSAAKGSVCAVCPTWFEIEGQTAAIRGERRRRGQLGEAEVEIETLQNIDLSLAQRKHKKYWPEDSFAYFARKVGTVPLGTVGTFHGKAREKLGFMFQTPALSLVPEQEMEAIQAVRKRTIKVSVGDKILLQANSTARDGRKLTNGTTATIAAIKDGIVTLEDGRQFGSEFRRFSLGYCLTSFSAQGVTCDTTIAVFPTGGGISKRALFVALSRGKYAARLYCDDISTLRQQLDAESSKREHAIEIEASGAARARRAQQREHADPGCARSAGVRERSEERAPAIPVQHLVQTSGIGR